VDGIFEGFKEVKILSGQGVVGEEQSIRVMLLLPVFSNMSVVTFCHVEGGFQQNI
jgi:hypothetical protein